MDTSRRSSTQPIRYLLKGPVLFRIFDCMRISAYPGKSRKYRIEIRQKADLLGCQ